MTAFYLLDERRAAKFLRISLSELDELRRKGRGPRYYQMPTGEIRFTQEDLEAWALGGNRRLTVAAGARVIPFPGSGVKVRHLMPENPRPPSVPVPRRRNRKDGA